MSDIFGSSTCSSHEIVIHYACFIIVFGNAHFVYVGVVPSTGWYDLLTQVYCILYAVL